MGLSVKWATCNIGASKPEDYGLYFAWAETTGYKDAASKPGGFSQSTAPYYDSATGSYSKYLDGRSSILEPEDDAAHVNMGGGWRMPFPDDYEELYDACTSAFVERNGVQGLQLVLKSDPSKVLFFPAAGCYFNTSGFSVGGTGYYWTNYLFGEESSPSYLIFNDSFDFYINNLDYNRHSGMTIRGVLP